MKRRFLAVQEILALHKDVLDRGESDAILNRTSLESAVARPMTYHRGLLRQAAVLFHAMIQADRLQRAERLPQPANILNAKLDFLPQLAQYHDHQSSGNVANPGRKIPFAGHPTLPRTRQGFAWN